LPRLDGIGSATRQILERPFLQLFWNNVRAIHRSKPFGRSKPREFSFGTTLAFARPIDTFCINRLTPVVSVAQ
jgi:hypothetical protein